MHMNPENRKPDSLDVQIVLNSITGIPASPLSFLFITPNKWIGSDSVTGPPHHRRGISGRQNADANDASTHAALHV